MFGFSYFAYVELTSDLLCGRIQSSQTGGQLNSYTFPCAVSEYSESVIIRPCIFLP